jgi:hypothetical protein
MLYVQDHSGISANSGRRMITSVLGVNILGPIGSSPEGQIAPGTVIFATGTERTANLHTHSEP